MDEYFALGFTIIAAVVGLGIGGLTAFLFFKDVANKRGKDDEKVGENGATSYVSPGSLA